MNTTTPHAPWWVLDEFAGRDDPAYEAELLARLPQPEGPSVRVEVSQDRVAVAA